MLEYFVDKICTILTQPLNRDFREEDPQNYRQTIYQYFLGKVLAVDERGILIEQILTPERLRSYFFFHSIVAICEEQSIEANSPEKKDLLGKIYEAYEESQKTTNAVQAAVNASPTKDGPIVLGELNKDGEFINAEKLSNVAQQMKEKFGG